MSAPACGEHLLGVRPGRDLLPAPRSRRRRRARRTGSPTSPGRSPSAEPTRSRRRPPPSTTSGGRLGRAPAPATIAPIARSGSAMRSIGRVRQRRVAEQPSSSTGGGRHAGEEAERVPELPQSIARAASRSRAPAALDLGPPVGRADRRAERLDGGGGPGHVVAVGEPRTFVVPSASAAMSRARWEIDLSPGVRTAPVDRRPPSTRTASRSRPAHDSSITVQEWPRSSIALRSRAASSTSTNRVSTPLGPSAEWAIVRS